MSQQELTDTPRELVSNFKRQGHFDAKRKELLDDFNQHDNNELNEKLNTLLFKLIDLKAAKDPSILVKNKGKISALIQTALIKDQFQVNTPGSANRPLKRKMDEETKLIHEINILLQNYVDKNIKSSEALQNDLTTTLKQLEKAQSQDKGKQT